MRRATALLHAAPAAMLLIVVPASYGLAQASAQASAHAAEAITAEPTATEPTEPTEPTAGESASGWGPIVGGCLGVLFGGVLAVWQIRGMKRRGR